MKRKEKQSREGERHRELDQWDRAKVQEKFLCNIVNGQVAPDSVNVQNALQIGEQQSNDFSASLPQGFHETDKGN